MGTRTRPRRRFGDTGFARYIAFMLALAGCLVLAGEARLVGDAIDRAGLEAFYAQPADAAVGDPGTIVRAAALDAAPLDARAWRLMYRTTDLHGTPVVATGILVVPLDPVPGPRTVVAWGHPTTGTHPDCAPSRSFDPFDMIEGLRFLLDRGYTVVATDYVGMGTAGPDSYLVGATAAHSMLDAVRAAQRVDGSEAGDDVILWGHSQGGQAALFAAELADAYAPELHVEAVAVAAPAADLTALMGDHLDDISGATIGSYAFTAFSQVYADRGAEISSILTPEAVAIQPEMNRLCLLSDLGELHRIAQPVVGRFTSAEPTKTEPWATLLTENSAGGVGFDAPLFVAQGLSDELVLPSATRDFVAQESAHGMHVTLHEIEGAVHGTIAYLTLPALMDWLDSVGV
ncbi:alpha/beta fold hydrolase [Microbacterium telephonicum]|uniref:Secretory lipase n=1 Tax=Microbacterium telephonicum TaxID=1714841 RepID=A0A498C472_9MICO|nr:alpha/beta fold hydrolase [Microbacterium telephonicum]RLK49707.1 secretory lipase [Microbacterium telephonicum]